jgi:hypothetical protein
MCFRFNNWTNPYLFRDTLTKLINAPNVEYKDLALLCESRTMHKQITCASIVLIVAIALQTYPVGQWPANRQREMPRAEQQQPSSRVNNAPNVPIPEVQQVAPEQRRQNTQDSNESEDGLEKATWWLVYVTGALVLVGIVASLIALFTLNDLRKQSNTATISAIATETSAAAALLNAKAFINSERAWVEIEISNRYSHFDPSSGEEFSGFDPNGEQTITSYVVEVTNYGRTVARILAYMTWQGYFTQSAPDMDKLQQVSRKQKHLLLAAGKTDTLEVIPYDDAFEAKDAIDGNLNIGTTVLRVAVQYEDIVSADSILPHESDAVFSYQVSSNSFKRVPKFSKYT